MVVLSPNSNDSVEDEVPRKKIKLSEDTDYINSLPDEVLTVIFSYLSQTFLYSTARSVCKRWRNLACASELWRRIIAGENITTQSLECWIKMATHLTEITLTERRDINCIAQRLARYSRNLATLKIENCWGTKDSKCIKGANLCQMVLHCKRLSNYHFSDTKIRSSKFFRLLSQQRNSNPMHKCNYYGPVSKKQLQVFIDAITNSDAYKGATINRGVNEHRVFSQPVGIDNEDNQNQNNHGVLAALMQHIVNNVNDEVVE